MSKRYNGGIITASPPTISGSSAGGMWTIPKQLVQVAKNQWHGYWSLVWTLDSNGSIYSISRPDVEDMSTSFSGCSAIKYSQLSPLWSEVKLSSVLFPNTQWYFKRTDNPVNLPLFLLTMLSGGNPGNYMTVNTTYSITLDTSRSSTPNSGTNPFQFMHNNNGSEPGDIPTFGVGGAVVWGTGMYWGNIDAFSNYGGLLNTTTAWTNSVGGNTGDRLLIYVR